jgi:hypothetical protein
MGLAKDKSMATDTSRTTHRTHLVRPSRRQRRSELLYMRRLRGETRGTPKRPLLCP